MLDLAIIIPCADDLHLAKCLESIDEDVEVVVALNGATDEIKRIVRQYGADSCEIAERNLGAACAEGVEAARSSNVLLMNSDCVFEKGSIRLFAEALREHTIVRGRVVFKSGGWASNIVAEARDFVYSIPNNAYQPGIAFKKDIIHAIGGYYFDRDIHWTEDADFSRRVNKAGIPIHMVDQAILYHPALTMRQDLNSAYKYGIGRRIAEEKALEGTHPPYRLRIWEQFRQFIDVSQQRNVPTALYMTTLWIWSFTRGYYAQIFKDVYGTRRKLREQTLR